MRRLARACRRADAIEAATAALGRRSLSEQEVDERLGRRGVRPHARGEAREVLRSAGYLDDARLAQERADAMAGRGFGDAAIRYDLERRGVAPDLADEAIGRLGPEADRARGLVAARGASARTARYLAARGFGEDAIDGAIGSVAREP